MREDCLPEEDRRRAESLRRELSAWAAAPPAGVRLARCPYRVCPLGAHVDHQSGCVTGFTVDRALLAAFLPTDDGRVAVRSRQFEGTAEFSVGRAPVRPQGDWADYARGAVVALRGAYPIRRGVVAVVDGYLDVAGLSSSAAVGLAYLLALQVANGLALSSEETIELARIIENDYIGLSSGILDQSVILLSRRGCLTHVDCASGRAELLPLGGARRLSVAVLDSGLRTVLCETDYNLRVHECGQAAARLLDAAGLAAGPRPRLRDVPPEAMEAHAGALPERLRRRAEHFFGEQRRVAQGADLWRRGDLEGFGRLMTESGRSSIELYECGNAYLRTAYELLRDAPGVYGARFSGAGFRGCCVALVRPECRDRLAAAVLPAYLRAHPDMAGTAGLYFCESADGASVLE